jgi:hypothetical protein
MALNCDMTFPSDHLCAPGDLTSRRDVTHHREWKTVYAQTCELSRVVFEREGFVGEVNRRIGRLRPWLTVVQGVDTRQAAVLGNDCIFVATMKRKEMRTKRVRRTCSHIVR